MNNRFEAFDKIGLSVLQMKQMINNYFPNFDFERIISRGDILDVFNRMITNGQYSQEVMEELDEQVRKRNLPYNMDSILTMIYEGVNILLTQEANSQFSLKQLKENRNSLDLLQQRGNSNYLIINNVQIPSSFFPAFTKIFSIIISIYFEDQIKKTYDTKIIKFNENFGSYLLNEQVEISSFQDECRLVIYGEKQEYLGYIQFKFCNLDFQQAIYNQQSIQNVNLYKIINEYQQDSVQTQMSLSLSINNIESAKFQLTSELQLYENEILNIQQNFQTLLQPFQQQKLFNFNYEVPQNQILDKSNFSYKDDEVKRAQKVKNPASQNQSIVNDISIAPDRGTMNPFQPENKVISTPAEYDLHILFIIYLGIAFLFGGKKSNMIDICICLYFLTSLFSKDEAIESYQLLKKRTIQGLGFVLALDLFWMIIIGSHWLAREQSDDDGIQNAQRVLTFIATLLTLIFRGFLAFLIYQTNIEEFPRVKAKFQELLLLKSSENKQSIHHI